MSALKLYNYVGMVGYQESTSVPITRISVNFIFMRSDSGNFNAAMASY